MHLTARVRPATLWQPNTVGLQQHRLCKVPLALLPSCWFCLQSSADTTPRNGQPARKHGAGTGDPQARSSRPRYVEERLRRFKELKEAQEAVLRERAASASRPIAVTLAGGKSVVGQSWRTSPYQISRELGRLDGTLVARVNGQLWDLHRPLEGDTELELLAFGHTDAKAVYWQSSAHVLGAAMEQLYGGLLCSGPCTEHGFYYDMYLEGRPIPSGEYTELARVCRSMMEQKLSFERVEVSREDLLELFKYNKFKLQLIEDKVKSPTATVYRCGSLVDLCRGPLIAHTGLINALRIVKSAGVHWGGDPDKEPLHRIHAISFPDNEALEDWKRQQEELKNRDHRKIGKEQELFFFHEMSPGSCFFLPKGAHIYNTLTDFLKEEYRKRGFVEVVTPNLYNSKLWEQSGHWDHYSENMFSFKLDNETYALKPMNCPGHCLMYDYRPRSWRELPLRLADFGVLHRNEYSGGLSGLVRSRRFQQDDAHIFCTLEQIEAEIMGCLDFLRAVYQIFGFSFRLFLSTRPEKFLGEVGMWDRAEQQLERSLQEFGQPWENNPGDGAFYGPKIDVQIQDALGRSHQCATVQLDFQLPARFNLTYSGRDGNSRERPVMIHRAILGSVERMMAILAENCAGKWPFWLSPSQVLVIPIGASTEEYAQQVYRDLHEAGFMVDVNMDAGQSLGRKIRQAQLAQYNFILVTGERERDSGCVSVRARDNRQHGTRGLAETVRRLGELKASRCRNAEEAF